MPEAGHLTREKIAALAGITPFAPDSGKMQGRFIQGGRTLCPWQTLYVPHGRYRVESVTYEPYQHLLKAGEPKQLALVVSARESLVIMNSMLRNKTTWQAPAIAVSA